MSTLIDMGCGDFFWIKEVILPCQYIGRDIVASIIEENNRKYRNEKRVFQHHNAVSDTSRQRTQT
ncbi:MAG: hypothetical protein KI786_04295 [Mameliella sp.]|nr:hypothetical protein [Phaeodactylibacter sp.]